MHPNSPPPDPHAILAFWFGTPLEQDWPDSDRRTLWFGSDPAQDEAIADRFGHRVAQALDGGLVEWEDRLPDRLALLLLLDQFSRNIHRGSARAFEGDPRAQRLVLQSLDAGDDLRLPTVGRVFLYMPLMHAENLELQEECVRRFHALHEGSPARLQAALAGHLGAARQHRDIVARFGRFPHRNEALGRTSSGPESLFLLDGPRFGQ